MMNTKPDFEDDKRHFLYQEYLRILAEFLPPVFVMENVPGLLSSKVRGVDMFEKIRRDLESPPRAIHHAGSDAKYTLYSLVVNPTAKTESGKPAFAPRDYIVRAEDYGIPQRRHRVILLGIRTDLKSVPHLLKKTSPRVPVADAIGDMPPLRSQVSRRAFYGADMAADKPRSPIGAGAHYTRYTREPSTFAKRLRDCRLGGFIGHEARSHMASDIQRYTFAARFAARELRSPKLADFPADLLPDHENVKAGVDEGVFSDRFRVQLSNSPSTTVTSHISKDGHYYIHYDPDQARSFTVREAARVQSFPDNYFFEGNRTQQYHQVGNAVPPLLARQVAEAVYDLLVRARLAR
jgi:DNA (cytosine-5)-methyltransferase 1